MSDLQMVKTGVPMALSISIMLSTNEECNARCRSCISRMTPGGAKKKEYKICEMENIRTGFQWARNLHANTAILTGKADPTQEEDDYLCRIIQLAREMKFPCVDMHTNGLLLQSNKKKKNLLGRLRSSGLTNITFSIASFDSSLNQQFMGIKQNPEELILMARKLGLIVRCSLLVTKSTVSDTPSIMEYIKAAGNLGANAIVIRELWIPEIYSERNQEVYRWNKENFINISNLEKEFVKIAGEKENKYGLHSLRPLPWGAPVFGMSNVFKNREHGVNVTFARCDDAINDIIMKSIVHKPDGLTYREWDCNANILF
jgi:molybdenum cofactor biosynthesis enzyme MoaA